MREIPTDAAVDDVLAELDAAVGGDVDIDAGRAFTLAYVASPEVSALAGEAYRRFSATNALNVHAFPSLRRFQNDVVATTIRWLDGGDQAAGFMTSGGTESLLLTVLAARRRGARERGVAEPNMVLPTSAHAAFEKGADYFGVSSRRIPVGADGRADPAAMAAATDDDTVLLVASAPSYPHGVIDPVADIAAVARDHEINCHVDACMGGVILPAMTRLGEPVPPWNFAVDGVTSISVDLHKYGYTAKGAGVLAHVDKERRADVTFTTSNWLGGTYGSSGVLGTKSGGAVAAAWSVMRHLGDAGYDHLARVAIDTARRLVDAVRDHDELVLRARPDTTLVAFGARDPDRLDVDALAEELWRRGWYVDRQGPPPTLHCMVNAVHADVLDDFLGDLSDAIEVTFGRASTDGPRAYGTV